MSLTSLAISNVTAVNNVGTTPQFFILKNPTRRSLTFHNPGQGTVVVFPEFVLVNGKSQPLNPTLQQLGGGFALNPTATLYIGGVSSKQRWQALALSGSANPLTITEDA